MGKTVFRCLCALLAILFASCSKEGPLDKMEHIKMVGNDHPKQALAMLDSLEQEARRGSVYAQKKYDLLHIRLSDKANILPKSDAKIKELVEYFGKKGSDQEKQEVYYYAGSVYRDLQDCPRALEYFYKSTDFAIGHPDCDSIMLRNTYSNLNFLQYRVQNYKEALAMSKEELRISKELGTEDVVDHMHVGAAYKATGNAKEAVKEYDKAFHIADTTKDQSAYQESYIRLLMDYSGLGEIKKAQRCRPLIKEELNPYFSVLKDQALAHYYMACGKRDSAIIYSQRIIDNGKDQNNMYDAAKQLFRLDVSAGVQQLPHDVHQAVERGRGKGHLLLALRCLLQLYEHPGRLPQSRAPALPGVDRGRRAQLPPHDHPQPKRRNRTEGQRGFAPAGPRRKTRVGEQ